jgi:gluconokinase
MELVLGVDVGTTATKAVCFDQDGGEHGTGEKGYPLTEPNPGREVQDPHQVMAAADAAVAAATSTGVEVKGVCFSSAMHSLIGLDGDGTPLTPLLLMLRASRPSISRAWRRARKHSS